MTFWDFIDLAIFLIAVVILLPFFIELADRWQERRAQKERTKWRQMQDEHASNPGAESYNQIEGRKE